MRRFHKNWEGGCALPKRASPEGSGRPKRTADSAVSALQQGGCDQTNCAKCSNSHKDIQHGTIARLRHGRTGIARFPDKELGHGGFRLQRPLRLRRDSALVLIPIVFQRSRRRSVRSLGRSADGGKRLAVVRGAIPLVLERGARGRRHGGDRKHGFFALRDDRVARLLRDAGRDLLRRVGHLGQDRHVARRHIRRIHRHPRAAIHAEPAHKHLPGHRRARGQRAERNESRQVCRSGGT